MPCAKTERRELCTVLLYIFKKQNKKIKNKTIGNSLTDFGLGMTAL